MICEQCKADGLTSRVYPGGCFSTCMSVNPFYDEKGVFHSHDPNWRSTSYSCSNGHDWTVGSLSECPACDWAAVAMERQERAASVDRSPEGGDPEEGRHAKHESAVAATSGETPKELFNDPRD